MKFLVEYAKFMKVEIDADSPEEANEKANTMDDDYIEQHGKSYNPDGYIVWNEPKQLTIKEPRFLLDEDSICYGCPHYRHKKEVIYDHLGHEFDENDGCCDVHCVCVCGSMNTYNKND